MYELIQTNSEIMDHYDMSDEEWDRIPGIAQAHFRDLWISYQKALSDLDEYEERGASDCVDAEFTENLIVGSRVTIKASSFFGVVIDGEDDHRPYDECSVQWDDGDLTTERWRDLEPA